jgi:hypothetical protein
MVVGRGHEGGITLVVVLQGWTDHGWTEKRQVGFCKYFSYYYVVILLRKEEESTKKCPKKLTPKFIS